MAVQLEFINFIVPVHIIQAKYPGGWAQCLIDHEYAIGRRVWYDAYLFRDGAMNPMDAESLVENWRMLGFNTYREVDGEPVEWLDVCITESLYHRTTLPCKWIEFDEEIGAVSLVGAPPCPLVDRSSFVPSNKNPFLK